MVSWWGTPGWRVYAPGPNPDERLIYLDESGTVSYPHTDGLGSTIALSQGGTATAKYRYTAFGETPDGPGGYPWRYTGQRIDAFTGTYDFKAREYLPSWGRFVQPDPALFVDGPNLYAYVGNRATWMTDPTGLTPGDTFSTSREAAEDAIRYINPRSIQENVEYHGSVNKTDTGYVATQPVRGSVDGSPTSINPRTAAADFHTHGDYSKEGVRGHRGELHDNVMTMTVTT